MKQFVFLHASRQKVHASGQKERDTTSLSFSAGIYILERHANFPGQVIRKIAVENSSLQKNEAF